MDFSAQGWGRVVVLSLLGTLLCIAVAFAIDSYSFADGTWRLGASPWNNLTIPIVLAFPLFFLLLSRQRALAIAHHELMVVASTDGLTSCLTRRAFTTLVDAYLERVAASQSDAAGSLLVIDVDHFKTINDDFGHDRGDEALKLIAGAIKGAVREIDLVGRLGGEEFSVFMPGTSPERTAAIAERIRLAINDVLFIPDGTPRQLSVSVGGAALERRSTFAELYRHADQCLYEAKRTGRNRVRIDIGVDTAGKQTAAALH